MASVSSGRVAADVGLARGHLGHALLLRGHLDVDLLARAACATASIAPGRTEITGVSPVALASTVNAPPKMECTTTCRRT